VYWITVITFSKIYWILHMHSNVTIENVSWPHFSWPTLYVSAYFYLSRLCYFGCYQKIWSKMSKNTNLSAALTSFQRKMCWINTHPVLWTAEVLQDVFSTAKSGTTFRRSSWVVLARCVLHDALSCMNSHQTWTMKKAITQKWDEIDDQSEPNNI